MKTVITEYLRTGEISEIFRIMLDPNNKKNVVLDAPAGTGKTAMAKNIKIEAEKLCLKMILTAVTGVAANNIGGVTISSLCRLGRYEWEDHEIIEKAQSIKELRDAYGIIIDEVSTLTPEQLRQIDLACRAARNIFDVPFGGLKVLIMGDDCQLEPIEILGPDEIIAVSSVLELKADLHKLNFVEKKLTRIFRQTDKKSLYFLDGLREMIYEKKLNRKKIDELENFFSKNKSIGICLYSNVKDLPKKNFHPDFYYEPTGKAPYESLPVMYGAKYLVTKNIYTNDANHFNGQVVTLTEDNFDDFLVQDLLYKKVPGFDADGNPAMVTVVDKVNAEYIALLPLADMTTRRAQGLTLLSGLLAAEFFALDNNVLSVSEIAYLKTLYTAVSRFVNLADVSLC